MPKEIKKSSPSKTTTSSKRPSLQMLRIMRGARAIGILLGGFVTLVTLMAMVGVATDNFIVRLVAGLVLVIGFPGLLADRLLKRTNLAGGLGLVGDVFAIVLLATAMVIVTMEVATKPLLTREGDRYARSGSTFM